MNAARQHDLAEGIFTILCQRSAQEPLARLLARFVAAWIEERYLKDPLIAAAPDLLAACRMLVDDPGLTAGAHDVLRDAIAKATGKAGA